MTCTNISFVVSIYLLGKLKIHFSQVQYVELTKFLMNVEIDATTRPVVQVWTMKTSVSQQKFVYHNANVLQTLNEIKMATASPKINVQVKQSLSK